MKRIVIEVKRDDGAEPTAEDLESALGMIAQGIESNTTGGYGRPGNGSGYRWKMSDESEDAGAEGGE